MASTVLYRLSGRRAGRLALLLALVAAWVGVVVGVLADLPIVIAAAAVVAGFVNVALAKLVFESRTKTEVASQRVAATAANVEAAVSSIGETHALADRLSQMTAADLEKRDRWTIGIEARIDEQHRELRTATDAVRQLGQELTASTGRSAARADLVRVADEVEVTREALSVTRRLVDKLAARARTVDEERLARAGDRALAEPLLSIAIPSFNRPVELAECLASLEREIGDRFDELVEVVILDDASTDPETMDVALDFVERHAYASLRRQRANMGIERNVLAAVQDCRGAFTLLFGNDDAMIPGALGLVVDDLQRFGASVYLFEKSRVNVDGSPRAPVPGSSPADLSPGEACEFPTLLAAASRQGFFSTFGFISPIVFRTEPFAAVDPEPYFDLTMYPHVFVMVEAFGGAKVRYRNVAVALHRTPSRAQKIVEALGRREQDFMGGGPRQRARYFGTTLAAAWQRVIDRGGIDHERLRDHPETLMTDQPVLAWIEQNRSIDPQLDERLEPGIAEDAERFVSAFQLRRVP